MRLDRPFHVDPDYVPPPLDPDVAEEVQRILDAEARLLLERRLRQQLEQLDAVKPRRRRQNLHPR
jgi:hypothetical protein